MPDRVKVDTAKLREEKVIGAKSSKEGLSKWH